MRMRCLWEKYGFGRQAIKLLIEFARTLGAKSIGLSFVDKQGSPEGFYRKLGFERDGNLYDGEIGMAMEL